MQLFFTMSRQKDESACRQAGACDLLMLMTNKIPHRHITYPLLFMLNKARQKEYDIITISIGSINFTRRFELNAHVIHHSAKPRTLEG